ncbi:MAG: FG-GAP repeat domain-containing protein, partial [Candidatus Krumholzibacteriia bacterium]
MYLPLRKHISFPSTANRPAARLVRTAAVGVVFASSLLAAAGPAPEDGGSNLAVFVEVSASLGINITPTGDRADWGHGAAFCDYDGDNDLDLYVVMGAGQANKLFENRGAAGFVDVAAAAGVADAANGRAVVWADYDNDGDKDIFVSNYLVPSRLYRNNGDGTFTNRATAAGMTAVGKSHSAAWADYDNDGNLDLFVGNYGIAAVPDPNLLYHSNGDGTFTEVAASAGVADSTKPALACTWVDYDSDNDPDLYIAYDKTKGNVLYRNNGDGTFT